MRPCLSKYVRLGRRGVITTCNNVQHKWHVVDTRINLYRFVYDKLLREEAQTRKFEKLKYTSSAIMFYWALDKVRCFTEFSCSKA